MKDHSNYNIPTPKDVRQMRCDAGLSQKELGERMGMSQGIISFYESGARNLSVQNVLKIIDIVEEELEEE